MSDQTHTFRFTDGTTGRVSGVDPRAHTWHLAEPVPGMLEARVLTFERVMFKNSDGAVWFEFHERVVR